MTHEAQHLDARSLLKAAGVLGGGLVLVLGLCLVLWRDWVERPSPVAPRPAEPALQATPSSDRASFSRQQADADRYGWVDKPRGVARVPVKRAMEIMAQERGP